mgnify:CR=1 FL=1
MLAVRDLNKDGVPRDSWTAKHLAYTHGYGAVVAPFVEFFARGLVETEVRLGWKEQGRRAALVERCQILEERYDENGLILRLRAPAPMGRMFEHVMTRPMTDPMR